MGVDSGLPDFRGKEGFWNAYPAYRHLRLSFSDLANPAWFERDPEFAWGFYGHRLNLYRETAPHAGFQLLRNWASRMNSGLRVFTSNVDGHFQKSGFPDDAVTEVHGSIHHLQCTRHCGEIWDASETQVAINSSSCRAVGKMPHCPCGALARPNVLMFEDDGWRPHRTAKQEESLERWLQRLEGKRLVVVECGAGTAIPTVRYFSERSVAKGRGTLIRINLRDPYAPSPHISLPMGALAALQAIDALLL